LGRSGRGWRAFCIAIGVLGAGSAAAQDVASFYAGQTVHMIIGYPTGGSNDIYALIGELDTLPPSLFDRVKTVYKER
jgi:hypothetical protein